MLQLSFVRFKKGAYIFVEGNESNDRFFIIQSGSVVCSRTGDASQVSEKTLGPGDFLGVISCMTGHLQLESCMAASDVQCIAVRREQYPELIEKNVPVALKIVRSFAADVRAMDERLAKFTLNNTGADTPEHIFDVAEYYSGQGRRAAAVCAYYRYLQECPDGAHASEADRQFRLLCRGSGAVHLKPADELSLSYPQGTMIFSESQRGSDMFVIQSGQVAITKVVDGSEIVLAILKKGDMFGEMALLEDKPRSACALAQTDCQLMAVNRKNFDIMVSTQPQLIARLTTMLSERLWMMYRHLDNAGISDVLNRMIDMLALQLEKGHVDGVNFQTDFTADDIAAMCGFPQELREFAVSRFSSENKFAKIVDGKIFVPNYHELIRVAAFYRKKRGGE